MQIGLIGLGKMGAGMARRLVADGHDVVGFDLDAGARTAAESEGVRAVASLDELVASVDGPRVLWVMLPPGAITGSVIAQLAEAAEAGDLVVDGGNSDFRDAPGRRELLAASGIRFADVGVSGGQWGWKNGYGLMVGAALDDFARLEPVLRTLSHEGGYTRVGEVGAGHLVKAVHNGVQYGILQAYAEGFAVLSAHPELDALAGLRAWQQGSSVRSWLLENMIEALASNTDLEGVGVEVSDSGMGRWTTEEAVRLGVPVPIMTTALYERFASRGNADTARRLLVASRKQIGGHA
jgi:6-phosphogluconate dehydrogenase